MRLLVSLLVIGIVAYSCDAKRKRKFDGDFEFAEEDETKTSGEKKRWIHDPTSDLCRPLNCKKKEMCLLEDAFTAVCVSKKELQKNGDVVVPKAIASENSGKSALENRDEDMDDDVFYDIEDDIDDADEDLNDSVSCKTCPVVKPTFLCGNDNRTYSSLCRLDYHNCIHHTNIRVTCKGFCPCKENETHLRKKQRQQDRLNSFMNKYKATLDKSGTVTGPINGEKPGQPMANNAMMPPQQQAQQQQMMLQQQQQQQQRSDVYTFTPQDFKYENKHYKYIKYTKYNKDNNVLHATEEKDRQRYNEVLDNKLFTGGGGNNKIPATPSSGSAAATLPLSGKQCQPGSLQAMGNRLLDWFSVVMADSSKRRRVRNKSKATHFPGMCKGEVRWMFQHLDANGDARLSLQELYDLEHDQSEICLKPFLQQCDTDGDMVVSAAEWCRCFQRTERPCAAVKHKISPELLGVYMPDCDNEGYYRPVQCHSSIGLCWCVDKHGVEFANTRAHGKPTCGLLTSPSNDLSKTIQNTNVDASDDEDGDDFEQDIEGSADHPNNY